MNTNPPSLNKLVVLFGGVRAEKQLIVSAAEYAVNHPLYLSLPGGQISTFFMAFGLHYLQKQAEIVRRQIYLVETYTCLQTAGFLEQVTAGRQPRQAFFALDFLSLFNDDGVPYSEAREMLSASVQHLEELRQFCPVMVHITNKGTGRKSLLRELCAHADLVLDENLRIVDYQELPEG